VSIYGQGLAHTATVADQYPLPQPIVAGASVTMNGWPAPIFYASPGQLNVQVPFEVSGPVTVTVSVDGVPVNAGTITVHDAGPGIFLLGQGRAAALNADYSINTSSNPVAVGKALSLYVTGLGAMSPVIATGAAASGDSPSSSTVGVTATIGGKPATVIFAGGAPGYAGLDQVNVTVPQLSPGDYPVRIFAGSAGSNSATISVR
jgi:adhesin/invasin